jgi:uncharacterized protein (TIGR02145 family)
MSFNGLGSWTDNETYNTGAASLSGSTFNHGRTANASGTGGRGICPEKWHVPTDNEWGLVLDGLEGKGGVHSTATGTGWLGTNAGKYGKSASTGTATDQDAYWADDTNRGTDAYGFHALPAGYRRHNGGYYSNRGTDVYFWSSSAYDGSLAWRWRFSASQTSANRSNTNRSIGNSVRCIRD